MAGPGFLGRDMHNPEVVPYFTWDAPMTVREIRGRLSAGPEPERLQMLGKILREARDTDVWAFTTPRFVSRHFEQLEPHLGRRRAFWRWLLTQWREAGLVAG